jgi:leucyl aminopeptidase
LNVEKSFTLAFAEGMALGAYNFEKYKTSGENKSRFSKIIIYDENLHEDEVNTLNNTVEACFHTRDLVNEPANELTARVFAEKVSEMANDAGMQVKIFDKNEIIESGMIGLLTVNKGSVDEPTFIVMEWKPADATNEQPYVLVGKGLVYDTGGINLKPGNSLDGMKSDMAGGAAVFGVMYALAKNKVPLNVVGLIPATDNRPGGQAMVPGDVIRMANGKTIEVINTDAEGRIILADALPYAKKFDPALVIDLATLTGSAAMAIGKYGIVGMHSNALPEIGKLIESGYNVYERVVEFPFWEEYDKEIESDIADIRNLGKGKGAGAITAGKFLSNFIDYPWIHLDIAGMAFMDGRESYLGKGGTAVGVRLLYDFLGKKLKIEN